MLMLTYGCLLRNVKTYLIGMFIVWKSVFRNVEIYYYNIYRNLCDYHRAKMKDRKKPVHWELSYTGVEKTKANCISNTKQSQNT